LTVIYFDSCIAIYLVEEHPAYHMQIETALRGGKIIGSISPLVEMARIDGTGVELFLGNLRAG